MPLSICSLNSGSNGNCYYIGNETEAILVDAGLSCKETEKRMTGRGLDINKVCAIFISHEHTDHIYGLQSLTAKYQIPVYCSSLTGQKLIPCKLMENQTIFKQFYIGGLTVTAFPKYHDAVDPYSFVISDGHITIGVFTDIGRPCAHLKHYFKMCHAAFLEANYDDQMLENGNYPNFLKKRIKGGKGHLSNKEALQVYKENRSDYMSHLILSHLSKENNCPEKVKELFSTHSISTKIIIASREEASPVFSISYSSSEKTGNYFNCPSKRTNQLSLFNY